MAIMKLARINVVGDDEKTVVVEVSGDGKEWKLRALWKVVKNPWHNVDEEPNEYVHLFIIDVIRSLITLGYKFV